MTRGWGVAMVAALSIAGACVRSEITRIGPARPSRPENCEVSFYPTTRPPYPYDEIASVRAECDSSLGRAPCIGELKRQACEAGADTIVGFSEGMGAMGYFFIAATLGVRTGAASTPPAACTPICSPGFACDAGKCIPQCNPPCEAGESCSRKRVCEPVAGSAPASP